MGRTTFAIVGNLAVIHFNSLAPCGANPSVDTRYPGVGAFQLTRPVWGEPREVPTSYTFSKISTHSPRVGRTHASAPLYQRATHFNSLAPCGANLSPKNCLVLFQTFQLTRPVWGEPRLQCRVCRYSCNFNSLAPCGANPLSGQTNHEISSFQLTRPVWGEPSWLKNLSRTRQISTRSPRVGRTVGASPLKPSNEDFNSLAPCGANPPVWSSNSPI